MVSLAMSNSKKFEIGVEVDKNLDSYPFTPILPLVVVLAKSGQCHSSQVARSSACMLL